MIIESLKVFLFGMIGIFIVMGIIIVSLVILNRFSKDNNKKSKQKE